MGSIKTYFVDSEKCIDILSIKSGYLNREFNVSSGSIVAFNNKYQHSSLTFVFEKSCSQGMGLLLSKLFLMVFNGVIFNQFNIKGFNLYLDTHQLSQSHHYFTSHRAIFAHSIQWSLDFKMDSTLYKESDPKDIAITVLNEFKLQTNDIFK